MTLPRGMSSGRGRGALSKANPPRTGAAEPSKAARKPLERRKPLVQREAHPASGTTFKRKAARAGTRSGHRMTDAQRDLAAAWRHRVIMDSGGRDAVTGDGLLHDAQVHHVIPQTVLWSMRRRLGLTADELQVLLWDPDNGMALNRRTHERHENGTEPIPRSALRDRHWGFARRLDAMAGTEWATARLERYPKEADRG